MTTSHLPDPQPSSSHTPFRQAEKHFKSRLIPHTTPSLPLDIIDLSRPVSQEEDEIWRSGWWGPVEDEGTVRWRRRKGKERERGERPFERGGERLEKLVLGDGTVGYLVADGCVLIPNYLDGQEQLKLLQRALGRYTLPPNPLSLSTHYDLPQNLFHTYTTSPQTLVPTLFSKLPLAGQESIRKREQEIGHRTTKDTPAGSEVGYEKILTAGRDWEGDVPGSKLSERSVGELMKELRWANLGWVYRWTTKSYDFDTTTPVPFPKNLGEISTSLIKRIPWHQVFDNASEVEWQTWNDDYRPDSGIVNFYQLRDTLMGHADRAELDSSRPLISISLGHAAIFLLGSNTREVAPRPIILRSGDVLIMSGPARQAYHGVPRIMEGTLPSHFHLKDGDSQEMKAVKEYISSARVNINARQVFPPGFERT